MINQQIIKVNYYVRYLFAPFFVVTTSRENNQDKQYLFFIHELLINFIMICILIIYNLNFFPVKIINYSAGY
jgi:hypothetical protein